MCRRLTEQRLNVHEKCDFFACGNNITAYDHYVRFVFIYILFVIIFIIFFTMISQRKSIEKRLEIKAHVVHSYTRRLACARKRVAEFG